MTARASGFALVTAIFLLVVLFGLGVFMLTLSGTHQSTPRQSLLATRVYYGAKAGLEWGIQRSIAMCPPPTTCAACATCAASTPFALSGAGLSEVNVTVACACTDHTGGSVYRITSTAVTTAAFGTLGYAQRRMEATVSNIP
jgi:MSHA biogenesis protein MshP